MLVSDRSLASLAASAGAAAFLFTSVILASGEPRAEPAVSSARQDGVTGSILQKQSRMPLDLPTLRAPVEPGDDTATLDAIETALTQASDGATYVWRRGQGRISGAVRPTSTFRDADSRICRHIEMQLRLGAYVRRTEAIACRNADGVWQLEG